MYQNNPIARAGVAGVRAGTVKRDFFAVDDLCDWVGAMGHNQAITPNTDALA